MPLVFSVDIVMGEEKKAATKQLTAEFSNKWDRAYLETCRYVCDSLSLNLVRAFILLVRGTRRGRPHPVKIDYRQDRGIHACDAGGLRDLEY